MWVKKGRIFGLEMLDGCDWANSHTQIPTADYLEAENKIRIYYSTRNAESRSNTSYIEVDADDPSRILYIHKEPILPIGDLGAFDDCGVMPSTIVTLPDGVKRLYYIGWNVRNTVRYHNSIGVAESHDGGITWQKKFLGPILDRTHIEPHFIVTPFVMFDEGKWKMWYCGCTQHHIVDGISEPQYQIKYAESEDGIIWKRDNWVCLPYKTPDEANARAAVVKDGDTYKMWFCYRRIAGYRVHTDVAYRIGYAESPDGKNWIRMDDEAGIATGPEEWDSHMLAYPNIVHVKGKRILFYNGNTFGKTGFGYAIWENK